MIKLYIRSSCTFAGDQLVTKLVYCAFQTHKHFLLSHYSCKQESGAWFTDGTDLVYLRPLLWKTNSPAQSVRGFTILCSR